MSHRFFVSPARLRVTCMGLCTLFATLPQAMAQESRTIEAERSRTRDYLQRVTAHQAREQDDAMTLGGTLSPGLRDRTASLPIAKTRSSQPAKASTQDPANLDALLGGVQDVPRPAPKRVARSSLTESDSFNRLTWTPDFSRQKLTFAQLAGKEVLDLPSGSALTPATDKPAADPDGIWSLVDLVAEGLTYSPVLRQVEAQRETTAAKKGQAFADLLPTLSTRVARGRANTAVEGLADVSTNRYRTSTIRVTQPLYNHTFYKNWRSTQSSEQAAVFRVAASREAVALSVVQAGVNLASARVLTDFSQEQEKQLAEVLAYLEDRAQSGASSKADLERARTRVLAARQQRIDQQATYRSALYEVERLTGQLPPAMRLPFLNQLPALPPTQAELRRWVQETNVDLRGLKAEVDAQEAVVAAQYGKLLPALSLSHERDLQSNVAGSTPMQRDRRLLLVLNWSVSLGGKEVYEGREAAAELRNRTARYDEEKKKIEQGLESDFTQLQSATQRLSAGESEQKSALRVVSAVREQMKTGRIGSVFDALDAVDRLYAARQKLAQALGQQMVAQAQLLRRLGTLSSMSAQAADTSAVAEEASGDFSQQKEK